MTTSQGGSLSFATFKKKIKHMRKRKKEMNKSEKETKKKKVDGHLLATDAVVIFWRSVFYNNTSATSSVAPFQHYFCSIVFCNIVSTPPLQYFLLQ